MKPQKSSSTRDDHAFLADFGLTKGAGNRGLTLTGQYAGSLDYGAPEQIRGEPYGTSSDLYAFAAVLYEALTGEVVFPYDTEAALLYAHLSEDPPRPSERRAGLPPGTRQRRAPRSGKAARGSLPHRDGARRGSAARARRAAARSRERERPAAPLGDDRRRPVLRPAPVIAVERDRRLPWAAIFGVAVALLALGVGGFALGRLTHPAPSQPRGRERRTAVAHVPEPRLGSAAVPAIPGLRLESAVALTSTDFAAPGTIVAGLAPDAEGPRLLPARLQAQLTAATRSRAVRLGRLQALDYPSLPAGAFRPDESPPRADDAWGGGGRLPDPARAPRGR